MRFLKRLQRLRGRNIILYYSGWLQKPDLPPHTFTIGDNDKNGFMTTVDGLDRSKGLDLILHTPGGEIAATESIVDYLRKMFGEDIVAFIPQMAMSAGTMISCACKTIVMGKQSSLGPIDPQYRGMPAHGIIEEFNQAHDEIKKDASKIAVWQPIIAKYNPTLIGECQKAITWSGQLVREWLETGMLAGDPKASSTADGIISELADHALTLSHNRHLSIEKCLDLGLKVERLEDDDRLQDAVLTVHHACIHTFSGTPATKIIENHKGNSFITQAQIIKVRS
jgi:hypothetical protein